MDRFEKIFAGVGLLAIAPNAFAYLDPGTGSMLIQGLIAAIAMAGITGRLYWHKLLVLVGIRPQDPPDTTAQSAEHQSEN
jgi:hypothetical protein